MGGHSSRWVSMTLDGHPQIQMGVRGSGWAHTALDGHPTAQDGHPRIPTDAESGSTFQKDQDLMSSSIKRESALQDFTARPADAGEESRDKRR